MKVKSQLPVTDPYAYSQTELQWRKEGRTVIDPQGSGKQFWSKQFCKDAPIYYKVEETRPATPEELAAWKEEARAKAREARRRRLEWEAEQIAELAESKGKAELALEQEKKAH